MRKKVSIENKAVLKKRANKKRAQRVKEIKDKELEKQPSFNPFSKEAQLGKKPKK